MRDEKTNGGEPCDGTVTHCLNGVLGMVYYGRDLIG